MVAPPRTRTAARESRRAARDWLNGDGHQAVDDLVHQAAAVPIPPRTVTPPVEMRVFSPMGGNGET